MRRPLAWAAAPFCSLTVRRDLRKYIERAHEPSLTDAERGWGLPEGGAEADWYRGIEEYIAKIASIRARFSVDGGSMLEGKVSRLCTAVYSPGSLRRSRLTAAARTASQNIGSVSGACSRRAFLAASNSGNTDCTVAQKRGLWFISRKCDSSCAIT